MSQMRMTVAQGRPQWVLYTNGVSWIIGTIIGNVGDTVTIEYVAYREGQGEVSMEGLNPQVLNTPGYFDAGISDVTVTETGRVTCVASPPLVGTAAVVCWVGEVGSNEVYVFIGQFE